MMNDMAGWIWPLLAVVIGLVAGLALGARRRGGRRPAHASARDSGMQDHGPASQLPALAEGGRDSTPQQRLLERLRAANLQLSSQLKSLAESNSRQAQEREQERQSDRLRQERELEELRQAHANELSHLMNTLVEQVDGLNKAHAEQIKALETEIERARQDGRRSTTHSAPGALAGGGSGSTRPGGMGAAQVTAAAAAPAAAPASTRSGAPASDYSVTLPMETFRGER
ncbi:hypothetical protein [Ideonella sp.]|uniref:hypothetical protein n=1 Tax=Ideonella sp. TaxID=1929293 RepID=UPI0035AE362F